MQQFLFSRGQVQSHTHTRTRTAAVSRGAAACGRERESQTKTKTSLPCTFFFLSLAFPPFFSPAMPTASAAGAALGVAVQVYANAVRVGGVGGGRELRKGAVLWLCAVLCAAPLLARSPRGGGGRLMHSGMRGLAWRGQRACASRRTKLTIPPPAPLRFASCPSCTSPGSTSHGRWAARLPPRPWWSGRTRHTPKWRRTSRGARRRCGRRGGEGLAFTARCSPAV